MSAHVAAEPALARLDAATDFLPDPTLSVKIHLFKEAVDSSRLEGAAVSLAEVLEHEARAVRAGTRPVTDAMGCASAFALGFERLETAKISPGLLSEVQLEMRRGSRGSARGLGEARRAWTQADLAGALAGLGRGGTRPALVRAGLAARPPGGADGRLARLLVAFHLRAEGCLRQPRLCLSSAFARRHAEYSRLLLSRSVDSVAPWLRFFLECVLDAALRGTETLRRVLRLREEHRALVTTELKNSTSGVELLDQLIDQPVVTVQLAQKLLDRSYAAANDLVAGFEGLGLLRETTGGTRNRLFQYAPYMSVFEEASVSVAPPAAATSVEGDLSPRG